MGTDRLSWGDLHVIVSQLPSSSAFVRATEGEDALWGLPEHLLAGAIDALNIANWQRSVDGVKGRNRPEPLVRPGVGPKRIGKAPLSMDEMSIWLGWSESEAN